VKHIISACIAAAVLSPGAPPAPGAEPVRLGCQLRSFGQGIYKEQTEFERLVRTAGAMGFGGLETNWKNLERYAERPDTFVALLKEAGVRLVGAHMGGALWAGKRDALTADVTRAAQFVQAAGGEFVVFSAGRPPGDTAFAGAVPDLARFLNDIGGACAKRGVRLLYHNHWWDCEDGTLRRLAQLTDPARVGFAFDTGHALRAGADPAAMIDALGARIGLVHFADFAQATDSAVKRPPLGRGNLDVATTAAAVRRAAAIRWVVLEEESAAADPRALVQAGLDVLRDAFAGEPR